MRVSDFSFIPSRVFRLFQVSLIAIFLGRFLQHWFSDLPYRVLIWDEALLKPIVEQLGCTWEYYANTFASDQHIFLLIRVLSIFMILSIVWVIRPDNKNNLLRIATIIAVFLLFAITFAYWKDYFWSIPQLMELCLHWMLPLAFLLHWTQWYNFQNWIFIGLASTFIGHGIYAMGYLPLPGNWVDLAINSFNCSEGMAKLFLQIVGYGDVIASLLLLVPRLRLYGLYYMAVWGFCAMLGRGIGIQYMGDPIFQFSIRLFSEMIIRFPQWLVALAMIYWLRLELRSKPV